jgi:hypothetical protein
MVWYGEVVPPFLVEHTSAAGMSFEEFVELTNKTIQPVSGCENAIPPVHPYSS